MRNTEIGCRLEAEFGSYGTLSTSPAEDTLVAYVETRDKAVTRLKIVGEHCPMDAGGQTVSWIGGVDDQSALDWMQRLAQAGRAGETAQAALWALALHAEPGALERLHALARERDGDLAEEAIFWLGEARGEAGFEALERLLDELPAGDTRRHVNFALSLNASTHATKLLKDVARTDRDPEQRADALFWLAQVRPEEASSLIPEVIDSERDEMVLERAVFALSQLPSETAGPMLLNLARDPDAPREVRRQALFWLAHEGDEESLAQLSELLAH